MARYLSDVNKVTLIHESGTYAVTSGVGHWPGQILSHDVTEAEGKIENRYVGALSRSFDNYQQGPKDVTGALNIRAQNFQYAFYAIGSVDIGSATVGGYENVATQVNTGGILSAFTSGILNPPFSFSFEDSKQTAGTRTNFNRTVNGIVPNVVTINATQGEIVTMDVDYMAESVVYGSGASTTITEITANRPYLWDDITLTLAGSVIRNIKSVSLEINNNFEGPHYLNGSRQIAVPFPGNKDYTLSFTADMDADLAFLYREFHRTGSVFNGTFDLNADQTNAIGAITVGSQHATFAMSGCVVTEFTLPSADEGLNEVEFTIKPKDVSAVEFQKTNWLFNPF